MPDANQLIRALMASPEEQQAVAQASQAAATHLRRPDLRGIQYGSQPDVQAARQQGLEGVAGTAAAAHPLAWPGMLIDALSSPAGAKDLSALHPNTTEMTSAGGELPNRLQDLQRKISDAEREMEGRPTLYKSKTTVTGRGKDRQVGTDKTIDTEAMNNRDRVLAQNIADMRNEAQTIIHSRQTFEEGAPTWAKMGVRYGGPALSVASSVPMGFFKPGMKSALMSALYGAGEAIGAESQPEVWDLNLPKDSPGYQQAHENLTKGDWWKEQLAFPAMVSGALGFMGSGLGHKGRMMWEGAFPEGRLAKQTAAWEHRGKTITPVPPPQPQVPQAPMAPGAGGPLAPMMNLPPVPPGNWQWKGRGGSLRLKNVP